VGISGNVRYFDLNRRTYVVNARVGADSGAGFSILRDGQSSDHHRRPHRAGERA
jgi:hypothetical protein